MKWISEAVAGFGETMGMPGLDLGPQNFLEFEMANDVFFGMEYLPELEPQAEMVVFASQQMAFDQGPSLRQALHLTDARAPSPWPLQAVASDGNLLLALRLPERAVTTAALEQAAARLLELHENIAARKAVSRGPL